MIKGDPKFDKIFIISAVMYLIIRYFQSKSILGLGFDYLVGTALVCVGVRAALNRADPENKVKMNKMSK